MLMFPRYVQGLENGDYVFLCPEHLTYYRNCIMLANEYLMRPENSELLKWIRRRGKAHVSLTDATDYAYCGLMYQLFEFQPFAGILDTEMDVGVVDIRPTRNLAKLTHKSSASLNTFTEWTFWMQRNTMVNAVLIRIRRCFSTCICVFSLMGESRSMKMILSMPPAAVYRF